MSDLPSGTVTFLFTDIEGSTSLWERDRSVMETAVERHLVLLRRAIEVHDGVLFKVVGDAVQAAFPTAPDAVAAALAAQRALAAEPWPQPVGPLRVRMALHTAAATPQDGDYLAPGLNRLSRLLAAGHGGQTLLSLATQDLARDALSPGADLRDMGEHPLRDLYRPERVFQLLHPDLPADFPSIRTLATRPNNLPLQQTPFVGRGAQVGQVVDLLNHHNVRLLTITGPGGVGKTRLALQAAADLLEGFPDGVWFVDLSVLDDATLVPSAIAGVLGVREEGGALTDSLASLLGGKHLLLVLDNFERIVDAASVVTDLLARAPGVKVLTTSRTPLHAYGEREFPLPPFPMPDLDHLPSVEGMSQYDAVRLFVERAQAVRPDFTVTNVNAPAVAEICYRLDGLPLAIELAAAFVKMLPPQALLKRLDQRLPLLTGGARTLPGRQQTMRNTIAWSHDFLTQEEQTLFRRLAVFPGGCTIEAAEAVASEGGTLDVFGGIASLIDKSLLRQEEGVESEPRFLMLETVREYGLDRLTVSGEDGLIRTRHAAYFAGLAEALRPGIDGPEQVRTVAELEAEQDNLRAAMAWAIEQPDAATALRLTANLWKFWLVRSRQTEGRDWLERSLAVPGDAPADTRLEALFTAGMFARQQGDYGRAVLHGEEGLELARASGTSFHVARSLSLLGLVAHSQGDFVRARSLFEEARGLVDEAHDAHVEAMILNNLGDTLAAMGDLAGALACYEESLAIWRPRGDSWGISLALLNLGQMALRSGDTLRAGELLKEGLPMSVELGDRARIADYLNAIGRLAAALGQWSSAARLLSAAAARYHSLGIEQFPGHRGEHDQAVATTRAGLGDEAFTAAWEAGQMLAPEHAVTEALSVTFAPVSDTNRQTP